MKTFKIKIFLVCSIVGVLNDPTGKLELTLLSGHTISKPDLTELIIEEDGNEEGEGWDSEVGEWNWSGTKGNVQEWNVEEDGDEGSFEEESEVTEVVDHTLLGEGEVSGLADHEISPLDADDRYEVTRLGHLEGFRGVADWGILRDVREHEEAWYGASGSFGWINWWISASSPGGWGSSWSIEQSKINSGVSNLIPSHLVPEVVNDFLILSSWNIL